MSFLRVLLLALLSPAILDAESPSVLTPEPTTPYHWRVVVQFGPHPSITASFRAQILRDIQAALTPALRDVGKLETVELNAIAASSRTALEAKFVQEGWPALDDLEFRTLSPLKVHFIRIAIDRNQFRIEARQHDGLTGLASPRVQHRRTNSPETVGRLVGLMLANEFGPVGLVSLITGDPTHVQVRFRGSSLLGFERFVQPGDICAVAVIRERTISPPAESKQASDRGKVVSAPRTIQIGQPREYTLIRTDELLGDGSWKCTVLTRFLNPFPSGADIVGYRCLKLATTDAPVQVRVVDSEGNPPVGGQLLEVRANDRGFTFPLEARDNLELRNGIFRTPRPMRNVACIVVGIGAGRKEQFPVPVLGSDTVVVRFAVDPSEVAVAAFERACQDLRGRIAECRVSQTAMVQAMGNLMAKGRNGEALERAQAGVKTVSELDRGLSAELEKLQADALASEKLPSLLLADSSRTLAVIRTQQTSIQEKAKELALAVAKTSDNTRFEREFRAKELTSQIRELVSRGEVPEALDMYDLLIDLTKDEEMKLKKETLEIKWKTRNDAHADARAFVLGEWSRASTLDEFQAARNPLEDAVETMAKNADPLGLRAVVASFEPAYARITTLLSRLDPNSETDRKAVKQVQEITQELRALESKAREEVKRLEGQEE